MNEHTKAIVDASSLAVVAGAETYLDIVLKENLDKLEAAPGKLIPVLVKAIQDLSAEVATLKEQINGR
jgi:hypothetical protein